MEAHAKKFLVAAALMLVSTAVMANDVIEIWGGGSSPEAARNDARALGRQACLQQGYSFSTFELVDVTGWGSNHVAYGLAHCF